MASPLRGRAFVLRIEPPAASRPFGRQSLTPPRRAGAARSACPAWRPHRGTFARESSGCGSDPWCAGAGALNPLRAGPHPTTTSRLYSSSWCPPAGLLRSRAGLRPEILTRSVLALRAALRVRPPVSPLTAPVLRAPGRRGDEVDGGMQKPAPRSAGHVGDRRGAGELVPLRGKSNCNTLGACSGPQTPPRGSKVACL